METLTKEQIEEACRSMIENYSGVICGLTDAQTFSDMVAEHILSQQGIINLDYNDVLTTIRGKDEADAIMTEFDKAEMKAQLEDAMAKLKEAHPNKTICSVMFQLIVPEEPELYMDDLAVINEVFALLPELSEIKWGLYYRNDDSNKFNCFILAGFQ